jgi:hypothetical protein
MLLGLGLLYVGAVLLLNGIWILGGIEDREIAVIDVFVGSITLLISLYLAFNPKADAASIRGAAFTLLFTFTYYWVAWNRYNGADGRGLGWFCGFVAVTAAAVTVYTLGTGPTWLALCWLAWAVLWAMFWLLLVLKWPIGKLTGAVTVAEGILTGWLPGFLILIERL